MIMSKFIVLLMIHLQCIFSDMGLELSRTILGFAELQFCPHISASIKHQKLLLFPD